VSLRVFNAFGPHQPLPAAHPPVIPHFLRQASQRGTLVIHGQGEQTRDFVFINDAVEALVAAATAPDIDRLVINIGSGKETSIKDLAQAVMETMNVKTDWMPKEDQDPGPSRMCADIRLARQKLGYQPHFDLREGLKRMIAEDDRFQPLTVR
jgi:UDP-glucose 4-epimerase